MADQFLNLYAVDPAAGRAAAWQALEDSTDDVEIALARRTLGVDCRDTGDAEGARSHLRRAAIHAQRSGDRAIVADVLATRGGTLVVLGQPKAGLRQLTLAAEKASGFLRGTILYRRGVVHLLMGNTQQANEDAVSALPLIESGGDTPWLSRTLQLLGESELQLGHPRKAEEHFAACAARLGADAGYESVRLRIMRTWLAFLIGDLPAALAMFDVAEAAPIEDGRLRVEVVVRLATVRFAAGLTDEALDCLESLDVATVPASAVGQWRAMLARVLLHAGRPAAHEMAKVAATELTRMGLRLDAAEAALTVLEAEMLGSGRVGAARAERVAQDLAGTDSRLSPDGWILAGRVAASRGHTSSSIDAYAAGAAYRGSTDLLVAASGWLARAYELESTQGAGVLRACAGGLDALDDYRDIMGSSEIRAAMTHRGRELARVALRHAAHDPRTLLTWSERWRATALAQRPVTSQDEPSPAVALLRDSGRRIAEAREAGESTESLEKERRALERKVRAEHHQQRANGSAERERFDAAQLVADVGGAGFVQVVDVDGVLHALVVSNDRVRRVVAGDAATALELAESGRFALRRAARTGRFAPGDFGQRLQDAVLGDAARLLPDAPLVISPSAALHGAPFALMPALAERPFSVVPSAAQWMRVRAVARPRGGRRTLVAGPGLLSGGAEVARLADVYPDAVVLREADATITSTMKAIDGAALAHFATHGTFRADSPLFSALELADGPLSVYELERLKRAPYRTILSACDSGVLAPVGAQEVLGLASALFSLGSAGLLCSIAEVNDEATAELMMRVHEVLDDRRTPAEALAEIRSAGSPIEQATAAAFVALGV